MQRRDHYLLGCFIIEQLGLKLDPIRKRLFLFGCIEPDINPLTYTRGSIKYSFLHGHNAENAKKHLEKVLEKLTVSGVHSFKQWFAFGTALHYTADSFTFPHNAFFAGDLREHRCYENLLHPIFKMYIDGYDIKQYTADGAGYDHEAKHTEYLNDTRSFITDCIYITESALGLSRALNISRVNIALPDTFDVPQLCE